MMAMPWQRTVVSSFLVANAFCVAILWRGCYLPHVRPKLVIKEVLLHLDMDCFSV